MLSDVPASYIKRVGQGVWAAHNVEREAGVKKGREGRH